MVRFSWMSILLLSSGSWVGSQEADEGPKKTVVVTATRLETGVFDVPYAVEVIDREDLLHRNLPRTMPEALREVPGVMVQKTSQGQGSPHIRGFTGFRTLMLIDGIRLNNSVFRDGPNQYWNTIDPFTIERLEVVKGPSSVLYGSDAIGGTVNALTIRPHTYRDEGVGYGGRALGRYGSADQSYVLRVEGAAGYERRGGIVIGGSWRDYNDVDGGSHVGEQPHTGYLDRDFDVKGEYFLNENVRLVAAFQVVNLDDAWRTHKTTSGISWHGTTVGSERKRILDQDRQLAYLQVHAEKLDWWVDTVRAGVSWQRQGEEQFRLKKLGSGMVPAILALIPELPISESAKPHEVSSVRLGDPATNDGIVFHLPTRTALDLPRVEVSESAFSTEAAFPSPFRLPPPMPVVDRPFLTTERWIRTEGAAASASGSGEVTRVAAEIAYNPPPSYPRVARRRGYEGLVVLNLEVSSEGRVDRISVKQSSGFSCLDDAAADAVRTWRFTPAYRGTQPVRSTVEIPIRFQLTNR